MAQHIQCTPVHPNFVAEVAGVECWDPVSDEVYDEIKEALHKYGVLIFRSTGLEDGSHVEFARRFGPLDSMAVPKSAGVKMRIQTAELTDQSNLEPDGSIVDPTSLKGHFNKGNMLFHVDNSYNPQRARYSILRAAEIPASSVGGNTEFVDLRRAWNELSEDWKQEILDKDYEAAHSMWHSRKLGSPEFFARLDPTKYPMARRKLVEHHDGATTLYVPSHCHHIEGLGLEESREKLDFLFGHATQDDFVVSVPWQNPGDLIMWDNRVVLHRGRPMEGIHRRDLRRATVLDVGPNAQSLNEIDPTASWQAMFDVAKLYGALPAGASKAEEVKTSS